MTEQASSIEEITSAITEIGAKIQENAKNADDVRILAS